MISHTPIGRRGVPQVRVIRERQTIITRIHKALSEHHLFRGFTVVDSFNLPKPTFPMILMERQGDFFNDGLKVGSIVNISVFADVENIEKSRGIMQDVINVLSKTSYSNVIPYSYEGPEETIAEITHQSKKIPSILVQTLTLYAN